MARNLYWLVSFATISIFLLLGCNSQPEVTLQIKSQPSLTNSQTPINQPSQSPIPSKTLTHTVSPTPTNTRSPKPTNSPTVTLTPVDTLTPSITPTPTFEFPNITVNVDNAHCRYGPGKAYLHAADLYKGDVGQVWNRNYASTWLWVRFDKLNYACWVATSLLDILGDISTISTYFPPLPKSSLYNPPKKVIATRNGDQVIVTWEEVWMTEDDFRGYLIEAKICQNGYMIDVAVHAEKTSYTFIDERTCEGQSKGRLYAVEKHGYSESIQILWP
jgi:hypothetical protein